MAKFAIAAALLTASAQTSAATPCAEVSLVFSIDVSGSVSPDEFHIQRDGIVRALADPAVMETFRSVGTVNLAAVFFGDSAAPVTRVSWSKVHDAGDAATFAAKLSDAVPSPGGSTAIGHGLSAALDLLEDPAACARRKVVDVSGDGRETVEPRRRSTVSIAVAQRRAESAGVTVNGLVFTGEDPDLAAYYADRVLAGSDAFVMAVERSADFAESMKRKIMQEVGTAVAMAE